MLNKLRSFLQPARGEPGGFPDFPVLQTENLTLRQIIAHDQPTIFEGLSDERVIKYYGVEYHTYEATGEQMQWYNTIYATKTGIWWGIARKEDEKLIGACGFNNWQQAHRKAEMGYWLLPAYWKQGIMQEVLPVVLTYGFREMSLHRIEAFTETANKASENLLKKFKFQVEGTLVDWEIKHDAFISIDIWALLNKESCVK
ncbi:GNAT family N-acetyltransferase [Adhaeribacter aquaticus]|uniref:GNAT family N-acetyltransferase n=1 Tax=Adhaeribacter aquaticus TaxID=299567 RepID=UPI00041BDD51|nr:GNAT family protein [Adhaeribacter aquaticus]